MVAQGVADAGVDGLYGVGGAFQGGVAAGEVGEKDVLAGEAFEAFVGAAGAGVGVPPLLSGQGRGGGVVLGGGALVEPGLECAVLPMRSVPAT